MSQRHGSIEDVRARARAIVETLSGTFTKACEVALVAVTSGQSKDEASQRMRDAVEADIAQVNRALDVLDPPLGTGPARWIVTHERDDGTWGVVREIDGRISHFTLERAE